MPEKQIKTRFRICIHVQHAAWGTWKKLSGKPVNTATLCCISVYYEHIRQMPRIKSSPTTKSQPPRSGPETKLPHLSSGNWHQGVSGISFFRWVITLQHHHSPKLCWQSELFITHLRSGYCFRCWPRAFHHSPKIWILLQVYHIQGVVFSKIYLPYEWTAQTWSRLVTSWSQVRPWPPTQPIA
jgi:hypothetical protein